MTRYTLTDPAERVADARAELARLGVHEVDVVAGGETWLRFRCDWWHRCVRYAPAVSALRHLQPGVDAATVARVLSLVR